MRLACLFLRMRAAQFYSPEKYRRSYAEFRKGMRDYGVDMDEASIKALFARFDDDKSGSLDFDEFLEELRVRPGPTRPVPFFRLTLARRRQPPMSKARVKLIRMAFTKIDRDNSGHITWEDLKG